jgi:hypothetical protein
MTDTIPIKKESIPLFADNIVNVYNSATQDQMTDGVNWYDDTNRIANALANQFNTSVRQACAVIAAVSPLNSWGNNIVLASRILEGHANNDPVTSGYLSLGLSRANRILSNPFFFEDMDKFLGGNKIQAFYDSILNRGHGSLVCIDRHAMSIALNSRLTQPKKLTPLQYRIISAGYVNAAHTLSIDPQILQAITWVVWRQRYWSVGAFDGGEKETY